MKTYKVYFGQVNATCIEVDAKDADAAYKKAEREWKRDYGDPFCLEVKECQDKDLP